MHGHDSVPAQQEHLTYACVCVCVCSTVNIGASSKDVNTPPVVTSNIDHVVQQWQLYCGSLTVVVCQCFIIDVNVVCTVCEMLTALTLSRTNVLVLFFYFFTSHLL